MSEMAYMIRVSYRGLEKRYQRDIELTRAASRFDRPPLPPLYSKSTNGLVVW